MNLRIPLIIILVSLANPIPCSALFKKQSPKKEHKKPPKIDKKKSPFAPQPKTQPLSKPLHKSLPKNDLEQKIMTFFETNITPIYNDLNELYKGEEVKKSIETAQKKRAEREKAAATKRKSDTGRRQSSFGGYSSSGRRYSPSSYGPSSHASRRPSYSGSSYSSPSYRGSGKSYDPFSKSSSSFDTKTSDRSSSKPSSYWDGKTKSKDKKKKLDPKKSHDQNILEKSQTLQKDLKYLASKKEVSEEDFSEIYGKFTSRNSALLSSLSIQEKDAKKAQLKQQELTLWKTIISKVKDKDKNDKVKDIKKFFGEEEKTPAASTTSSPSSSPSAGSTP